MRLDRWLFPRLYRENRRLRRHIRAQDEALLRMMTERNARNSALARTSDRVRKP